MPGKITIRAENGPILDVTDHGGPAYFAPFAAPPGWRNHSAASIISEYLPTGSAATVTGTAALRA